MQLDNHSPSFARPDNSASTARPWNPLKANRRAAAASSYIGIDDGRLSRLLADGACASEREHQVHDQLVDKILGDRFPCVAARSAFNREGYRLGVYPEMGASSALGLCHDLYEFSHEFADLGDSFGTFIAAFPDERAGSELDFERRLWAQLQALHDIDATHFGWSPEVSSDTEDAEFSFSVGGRAYFVVGMHPKASRHARQTPWPVIVFNPHDQFERLRARGKYEGMQKAIRGRDIALQGDINPMLANFGDRSDARQYSGRNVPDAWACPFHRHTEKQQ